MLDRLPPQYSPQECMAESRRSKGFFPDLSVRVTTGWVRNITDLFLEADDFAAEEGPGGSFSWRRGGRPRGGGATGITGESESTGLRRSKETESTLVPIWRRKNLLSRCITR